MNTQSSSIETTRTRSLRWLLPVSVVVALAVLGGLRAQALPLAVDRRVVY